MYTKSFDTIAISDIELVGGKNASLGEMFQKLTPEGIAVPDGFATTAKAYWLFLEEADIYQKLAEVLDELDREDFSNLSDIGTRARDIILGAEIPTTVQEAILDAYRNLNERIGRETAVAVRSSATAEDLPTASFAGQLETYLNIKGEQALLKACKKCFASLFTDRAIKYREDHGFNHMDVALSVGVQQMVRSDKACSGVAFTLEPETGFRNVIVLTSAWGLGENVVQGSVDPDEYTIFKPSLKAGKRAVISKKMGDKQQTMVYADQASDNGASTINRNTSPELRSKFTLTDEEAEHLARWCRVIENHYDRPMDIEWAKDGISNTFYIVQARPETVHASQKGTYQYKNYILKEKSEVLATGIALGNKIASGKARILSSPDEAAKLKKGEVLVTSITNPDWDPIMKKAAAIITDKGGRTSHAAIVARELGAVAIVGCGNATEQIEDGQEVTVSCSEGKTGHIYDGILEWDEQTIDTSSIEKPETDVMLIMAVPDQAFKLSFLPNDGIGLMRLEFIINNVIEIHPLALRYFDRLEDEEAIEKIREMTRHYENKEDYFVDRLVQGVATIAAAFYPKDVIVRMSDFKSNEYANLIGGRQFEPEEENPMLGFRGASRYCHEDYRDGFELECQAMKIVRDDMGLDNIKLMIPFCRTLEESRNVIEQMRRFGLKQGENDLEIYTMIEVPSNVILAEEFAAVFDGFSIGSNDLTQLTLGLDRDSQQVNYLFDENDQAVQHMIRSVIRSADNTGTRIGLCGQAPSDFPEFARFLVEEGIDSISFNHDALIRGIENIRQAESQMAEAKKIEDQSTIE